MNTNEGYSEQPEKGILGKNRGIVFEYMNNATVNLLTSFHQTRMTAQDLNKTTDELLLMAEQDFFGGYYQLTSCPQELKIPDAGYYRTPMNFLSDLHMSVKENLVKLENEDYLEGSFVLSKTDSIMGDFREEDAEVVWWINNIGELGQKPNSFYRYIHFGVKR